MARVLKTVLLVAAAVLGLFLLCIVLVGWFFDPNHYKPQIERWVERQTGRSFTLDGELGWQFWPQLTLTLPHTRLGSAAAFAGQEFAEWQHASLSVRLWPLLQRRLELGEFRLHGLRMTLRRDAQGRDNWQDLLQRLAGDDTPGRLQFDRLAGLQIQDAELRLTDEAAQRVMTLQLATLQSDVVRFEHPVTVTFDGRLRLEAGREYLELPLSLRAQLQADRALQKLQMELQGSGRLRAEGWLAPVALTTPLPLSIGPTHLTWQADSQQVRAEALHLEAGAAQVTGQFSAAQLNTRPTLAASLQLAVPGLRQWLQTLGIKLPATRDATVLQRLQGRLQVSGHVHDLRVTVAQLQLDQTSFNGEAGRVLTDTAPRYSVMLHADQLNLDRYLPIDESEATARPGAAAAPLPIDWLRSLQAQGSLQIARAQWQGITARNLKIELDGE